jgi:hypothetical protein
MNNYNFNDNTLLHTCGFNFYSFVNILKNGIMSSSMAKEKGIDLNRNFYGRNLDDTISCVRYLYVNDKIEDGAYNLHIKHGISFIIEDVDFIYDKNDRIIHRYDEVLVKDYIDISKIKGILMPESYLDCSLNELEYIRKSSTSYILIKNNLEKLISFINLLGGNSSVTKYSDYLIELYFINEAFRNEKNEVEMKSLKEEFADVIDEINYSLGNEMNECFKKILGHDVCLYDVVNYFNKDLPVYFLKDSNVKKK